MQGHFLFAVVTFSDDCIFPLNFNLLMNFTKREISMIFKPQELLHLCGTRNIV